MDINRMLRIGYVAEQITDILELRHIHIDIAQVATLVMYLEHNFHGNIVLEGLTLEIFGLDNTPVVVVKGQNSGILQPFFDEGIAMAFRRTI